VCEELNGFQKGALREK